jgi:hypothetical protein
MLINPLTDHKPPVADEGTMKVPLAALPVGTKPGDRVSMTVTGVDTVSGSITLVADKPNEAVPPKSADTVDTELTMGPMDDLKSYLYKKTMEQGE